MLTHDHIMRRLLRDMQSFLEHGGIETLEVAEDKFGQWSELLTFVSTFSHPGPRPDTSDPAVRRVCNAFAFAYTILRERLGGSSTLSIVKGTAPHPRVGVEKWPAGWMRLVRQALELVIGTCRTVRD